MRVPKLQSWWDGFRRRCALGNLIDIAMMSVFTVVNTIMSASHPIITIMTTSSAIALSYAADVKSNLTKINKLKRLKKLLGTETEGIESEKQRYPIMSRGQKGFLITSASCLGIYVIIFISGNGSIMLSVLGKIAVVGASTIFHIAKKFYNSPLARDIVEADDRVNEVVRIKLPSVVEQESQVKMAMDLRVERDALHERFQELQQRLSELETQYDNLKHERARLQRQLTETVETVGKSQESIDSLQKQNVELIAKREVMQIENAQLRNTEVILSQQLMKTDEKVRLLEMVLVDKNDELSKLDEQCKSLLNDMQLNRERSETVEKESQNFSVGP